MITVTMENIYRYLEKLRGPVDSITVPKPSSTEGVYRMYPQGAKVDTRRGQDKPSPSSKRELTSARTKDDGTLIVLDSKFVDSPKPPSRTQSTEKGSTSETQDTRQATRQPLATHGVEGSGNGSVRTTSHHERPNGGDRSDTDGTESSDSEAPPPPVTPHEKAKG